MPNIKNPQPKPRSKIRITWTQSEQSAMILSLMGFKYDFISKKTQLSPGQIYYRIKLLNLIPQRRGYREGTSPVTKYLIATGSTFAAKIAQEQISKLPSPHKSHQPKRKAA